MAERPTDDTAPSDTTYTAPSDTRGAAGEPPRVVRAKGLSAALSADYGLRLALRLVQLGPTVTLVVLCGVTAIASPFFLTLTNLQNLGVQAAIIGLLGIGQLFPILTRGIDLSVGSTTALGGVLGAMIAGYWWGDTAWVVVPVVVAVGGVVGLTNGVLFVFGRIPHPFLVTLAMLGIVRGVTLLVSDGITRLTVPQGVITIGNGAVAGIPIPVLIATCVAIGAALLLRTQWGRWIYATGGDPEAARRVGLPVRGVLLSVYVASGLAAGLVGLIILGRIAAGDPTTGNLLELDAVTAVIIGGASFFGGRGAVNNAVVGALILAVIRNGLNLANIDPFAQLVVTGVIILLSVELDLVRRFLEDRLRVSRTMEVGTE